MKKKSKGCGYVCDKTGNTVVELANGNRLVHEKYSAENGRLCFYTGEGEQLGEWFDADFDSDGVVSLRSVLLVLSGQAEYSKVTDTALGTVYDWTYMTGKKVSIQWQAPFEYHQGSALMPRGTLRRGAISKREYVPYALVAAFTARRRAVDLVADLRGLSDKVHVQHYRATRKRGYGVNGKKLPPGQYTVGVYCKDNSWWDEVKRVLSLHT